MEQIERGVIVGRVDADRLAHEHRLQEIQRRLRRVLGLHRGLVVGVGQRVRGKRHVGAVRIAEVRIDLLEAVRLEQHELALPLPGDEILHGLEERHVDGELLLRHLLFDLLVQHIAEAAGHLHLDAGELLHEQLGAIFMRRGRPAGIKHHLFLGLGLLVKLIERFAARGGRYQHGQRSADRQ